MAQFSDLPVSRAQPLAPLHDHRGCLGGRTYDLVIGNPPFSSRTVRADDPVGRLSLSLHDYFIARSIERLRPGGLAVFVTSRWTMDKADPTARTFLASMADLVGAVRLPEGAMRATAGTDVVADILFFQKRAPDETAMPADWIDLAEVMAAARRRGSDLDQSPLRRASEHGPRIARADLERLRPDLYLPPFPLRTGCPF